MKRENSRTGSTVGEQIISVIHRPLSPQISTMAAESPDKTIRKSFVILQTGSCIIKRTQSSQKKNVAALKMAERD